MNLLTTFRHDYQLIANVDLLTNDKLAIRLVADDKNTTYQLIHTGVTIERNKWYGLEMQENQSGLVSVLLHTPRFSKGPDGEPMLVGWDVVNIGSVLTYRADLAQLNNSVFSETPLEKFHAMSFYAYGVRVTPGSYVERGPVLIKSEK